MQRDCMCSIHTLMSINLPKHQVFLTPKFDLDNSEKLKKKKHKNLPYLTVLQKIQVFLLKKKLQCSSLV